MLGVIPGPRSLSRPAGCPTTTSVLRGAVQDLREVPPRLPRARSTTATPQAPSAERSSPRYTGRIPEHRHGGIAMFTSGRRPSSSRNPACACIFDQRGRRTLQAAWTRHPERFERSRHPKTGNPLPEAVWINRTRDIHDRRNCINQRVNCNRQCLKALRCDGVDCHCRDVTAEMGRPLTPPPFSRKTDYCARP